MNSRAAIVLTAAGVLTASVLQLRQGRDPGVDIAQFSDARAPLEAYITAGRTGDAALMARAFHPDARMTYLSDTGYVIVPIAEFIARVRPRAVPDTFPRAITLLDVSGGVGTGRIDITGATSSITDYMTVMRFPEGWKIVHKSFHRTAR